MQTLRHELPIISIVRQAQEYVAVAELLPRGFDVYTTLVDDQQIDCIIRHEKNGQS
jgi:hypothetical protein